MPFLFVLLLFTALPACSKKAVIETSALPPETPQRRPGGPPAAAGPPRAATPPPPLPVLECSGQVLLTELLPDPRRASDRSGEYVELYNPSDVPVHLNGWRLTDLERDSHVIAAEPPVIIAPHGFVVLGPNADREANGGIRLDYAYNDFHLSNEADRVVLENPCGDPAFDLRYPTLRGWPKAKAGRAIERVSPPGEAPKWRRATRRMPSGDFGSPGTASWATPPPSPKGTPARRGGG